MQCECVDKEKIRSIIAGYYGVDLKDVKFGIGGGLCANVFNVPEKEESEGNKDDTERH